MREEQDQFPSDVLGGSFLEGDGLRVSGGVVTVYEDVFISLCWLGERTNQVYPHYLEGQPNNKERDEQHRSRFCWGSALGRRAPLAEVLFLLQLPFLANGSSPSAW